MKTRKLLGVILAVAMVLSISATALADNTTTFIFEGDGSEAYSVTVPSTLAPGGSGSVVLSGTWASNRVVTITADSSVTLTNSISGADQKTLAVTFAGISRAGDNTESISTSETVSVAGISNALFGTWSGVFDYQISIRDVDSEAASKSGSSDVITDLTGYTWVGNDTMYLPGYAPYAPAEPVNDPVPESTGSSTNEDTDQMSFVSTQTPVLDAVDNVLIAQQPTLGADVPGQAGAAGAAEGGAQELGPQGENPRPVPEDPDPMQKIDYEYYVYFTGVDCMGRECSGSCITMVFDPAYVPPTQRTGTNSVSYQVVSYLTLGYPVNTGMGWYASGDSAAMNKSVDQQASDAITFTGGADVANADLIAWLQANGTLTKAG